MEGLHATQTVYIFFIAIEAGYSSDALQDLHLFVRILRTQTTE